MDLDSMKSGIIRKLEEHSTGHVKSDFRFNPLASTLLQKISRNIRWELAIYLISGIGFIIMAFLEKREALKIYCSIFSVPILIFVPIYLAFLKRIANLMQTAAPVKEAVAELLNILKSYSHRYQQFSTLMVPVCMYTMFFLMEMQPAYPGKASEKVSEDLNDFWSLFMFFTTITVVITIISHFISKAYVNWLYGNHIKELEKQLKEFDGLDE